jgi:hypothetical protein
LGCSSLKDGKRRPCCRPGCTANSRMVKLDIATADWSLPTSGLRVMQDHPGRSFGRSHPEGAAQPRSASELAPFCVRYRFEVKCGYV